MTKIALIGSAPSSVKFGPYNDPTWTIWACSPGAWPVVPAQRVSAWFEVHRWEPPTSYTGPKPWFSQEYVEHMGKLPGPVYMIEPVPEIPNSVAYPKTEMLEKFGPFFMTSSLAWMLALAISCRDVTEIGLWGVDMSAEEEWFFQRSGCHHFIDLALRLGIKVTVPPESDLMQYPKLYGFSEVNPMAVKLLVRREELESRLKSAELTHQSRLHEFLHKRGIREAMVMLGAKELPAVEGRPLISIGQIEQELSALEQQCDQAKQETLFLRGALQDCRYHDFTWIRDADADRVLAGMHAATRGQVISEQIAEARAEARIAYTNGALANGQHAEAV